jgi:hypothetical protein
VKALLVAVLAFVAAGCAEPKIRRISPQLPAPVQLQELWLEPESIASRDLFYGPGGKALAPKLGESFKFETLDTSGYSDGYDVEDEEGREWSVKLGPEAQTEPTASRIYWAVGYHQPPTYFVAQWNLEGGPTPGPQNSARFRPEIGKVVGDWSLHENAFVGTRPYRGLLVLHVMLNNWDIKPTQNKIYEFDRPRAGVRRWFVVRDVGATFGKPTWPSGSRSNEDHFEEHPFIVGFDGDHVRFADQGRHDELLRQISRSDVRWIAERLAQITDRQWRDAFAAGGFPEEKATRLVTRLKRKIADGLNVCPSAC